MPEQLTGHNHADSHSYPLFIIGFIPLILAAAIVMTRGECLTGQQQSREHDPSKTPLMHRREAAPKPRSKWYQFWRRNPKPDLEQCTEPPNPTTTHDDVVSIISSYGTIPDFADFDGTHPAAQMQSQEDVRQAPTRPPRPSSSLWSGSSMSGAPQVIAGNPESFAHKYTLIRTLTPSSEGSIHLVADQNGKQYIIKQCLNVFEDGRESFPQEVKILQAGLDYQHPNIIEIVDTIPDDTFEHRPMTNIVTEYCDAGDFGVLIDHLEKTGQQAPRPLILKFISSMIDALGFLHFGDISYDAESNTTTSVAHRQPPVIHRDIKPANIFMKWSSSSKAIPEMILADFGHADTASRIKGISGTPNYLAPELVSALRDPSVDIVNTPGLCTRASDMFAFGLSLCELVTGSFDIDVHNLDAVFADSTVSDIPGILALLKDCVELDPNERPHANELYKLSSWCKREVQNWVDRGGRLDDSIWPNPPRGRTPNPSIGTSRSPSSVYSTPSSSFVSVEQTHRLRRVGAHADLAAASGAISRQPVTPIFVAEQDSAHGAVVNTGDGVFLDLPVGVGGEPGSAFSWGSSSEGDQDAVTEAIDDLIFRISVYAGT